MRICHSNALEKGQSTLELAIILPAMLLLLLAAADFGRALFVAVDLQNAAQAGAQYGSQSVITAADSPGMVTAAKTDGAEINNLSVTTSECTCTSGSTITSCPQSYCTNNPQSNYIEVDTHASFQLIGTYLGISSPIQLSGKAIMQVRP
jgi:Flp pilus assembly protein TadG